MRIVKNWMLLLCLFLVILTSLPAQTFNTPPGPSGAIAADFDRDGVNDFVFVSTQANTVNLLPAISSSCGSCGGITPNPWEPFIVLPAGQSPVAAAVTDWNSDTYPDLLVANAGSQDVSFLAWTGFQFAPAISIPLGIVPTSIAVTDVDFDGKVDFIVGHAGGIRVVYGGTSPRPPLNLATGPVSALAADNAPLVAVLAAGNVAVFKSDGIGGLTQSYAYTAPNSGHSLLLRDLNRDGKNDILTDNSAGYLDARYGDGLGNFATAATIALPPGLTPAGVASVDLRADLLPSLMVSSASGQAVNVSPGFIGIARTLGLPASSLASTDAGGRTATLILHPSSSQATVLVDLNMIAETSPSQLSVSIDNVNATAPLGFLRVRNAPLQVAAPSPQTIGATRYAFSSWSDGGAQTHVLYPPAGATLTAAFTPSQHLLNTQLNPPGAGSITASPSSPDGFYNTGSTVNLSATANACYTFSSWSPANAVVMNVPQTVTASFDAAQAANVTGQVTVTRVGNVKYVSQTGHYTQTVRIRNNGGALSQVVLVFDNLTPGATLVGGGGNTQCALPANRPYRLWTASLAPGATVSATVTHSGPAGLTINYTPRVLAAPGPY